MSEWIKRESESHRGKLYSLSYEILNEVGMN